MDGSSRATMAITGVVSYCKTCVLHAWEKQVSFKYKSWRRRAATEQPKSQLRVDLYLERTYSGLLSSFVVFAAHSV